MADSDSDWDGNQAADSHSDDELVVEPAVSDEADDEKPPAPETKAPRGRKPKRKRLPPVPPAENKSNYQKRAHNVILLDDAKEKAEAADADEESGSKPKKLRRVNFDNEYEEDVPSFERATDRGGYAHTLTSRMKISAANKGKMPWNKGKSRSETAKSKISAGVRARNRAILLEKLKKMGMTEEEWFIKKREIKLAREKVRKARVAVKVHEQDMEKARKMQDEADFNQAVIDAFERENMAAEQHARKPKPAMEKRGKGNASEKESSLSPLYAMGSTETSFGKVDSILDGRFKEIAKTPSLIGGFPEDEEPTEPSREQVMARRQNPRLQSSAKQITANQVAAKSIGTIAKENCQAIAPANDLLAAEVSLSTRQIKWTPHPLGSEDASYSKDCPVGGPGGLICCAGCSSRYSRYLSSTFQDLEAQQISGLGDEVEEIMGYARSTTKLVTESMKAVKEKH